MANVVLVDGSDIDIVSFDDSEQFEEEDSVCSWISDSDQPLNWSGWKTATPPLAENLLKKNCEEPVEVLSLIEICARCVAQNYAFEIVEYYKSPIPESLQLRIAYWSFPEKEEEIRLYSCLASGSNERFKLGEMLVKSGNVRDVLQIGFHLSGVVTQHVSHTPAKQVYNVAISFDRGHITSCHCTCRDKKHAWCEHATAVCLYRIIYRDDISLRAPVSESLTRLERDQLQKFAQYLISELPQQILPTAQRLLDELLSSKESPINLIDGAPDPTAGALLTEEAKWVLDEVSLRENIKKTLGRFCGVLPMVLVDVNSVFLLSAPPVSLEWSTFIRSFQSRDPEAIWNLLSIVRHMYACNDSNATTLLQFITEECLLCYQMMYYWLCSYHDNHQRNNGHRYRQENFHTTNDVSRYTATHLMQEIVHLWELAAMTPYLNETARANFKSKFHLWTAQVIDAAKKGRGQGNVNVHDNHIFNEFIGFQVAIAACKIDWNIYYELLDIKPKSFLDVYTSTSSEKCLGSMEAVYNKIVSILPSSMDEYVLVVKLTQALRCHGYVTKSSKLACVLANRIMSTYPDRMASGETNFASIVEKANYLCELFMESSYESQKISFEIAVLGLTVPRLPARRDMEEVRISYLEMSLYGKLKNIPINEDRLAHLRFQVQKFLAAPMLRGDSVLPLLLATFIFEVLCGATVTSSVLPKRDKEVVNTYRRTIEDASEGYKCALVSLGLCSNASDQKQPMLCESIRHQRRDLALAVFSHCRREEKKIEEVLAVILDKERYPFMSQTRNNFGTWSNIQEAKKTKKKAVKDDSNNDVCRKGPFTLADVHVTDERAENNPPSQSPKTGPSNLLSAQLISRPSVSHTFKNSSDSDSGHGEGGNEKCSATRNLPVPIVSSRKTQRRQPRQNASKSRNDKTLRNERSWMKHNKTTRLRRSAKSKTAREMAESDSGQEMMHFSFEGERKWLPKSENCGDKLNDASTTMQLAKSPLSPVQAVEVRIKDADDSTSGGGSSMSSLENLQNDSIQASGYNLGDGDVQLNGNQTSHGSYAKPILIPLKPLAAEAPGFFPALCAGERIADRSIIEGEVDIDCGVDVGFDDDFNIEPRLFHKSENIGDCNAGAPLVSSTETDEFPPSLPTSTRTVCSSLLENIDQDEDQENSVKHRNKPGGSSLGEDTLSGPFATENSDNSSLSDKLADIQFQHFAIVEERPALTSENPPTEYSVNAPGERVNVADQLLDCHAVESHSEDEKLFAKGVNQSLFENKHSFIHVKKSSSESLTNDESSFSADAGLTDKASFSQASFSHSSSVDSGADPTANGKMHVQKTEEILSDVVLKHKETSVKQRSSSPKPIIGVDDLRNALHSVHVPPAMDYGNATSSNNTISSSNVTSSHTSKKEQAFRPKPKKNKKQKNKKNKKKITMNIQSIEAEAYSLFELAKSVLLQARQTGIFSTDVDEVSITNTVNRRLQLAAYEIGLFALNMHNYSSPNWFSRTYSTYVSWIENQTIDIGTQALRVLNEKWEGVLTPSEAIQIATRASRSGDSLLKRTAAELALSCLCYSQSLSPADIKQTITICREQSHDMLQRACSAVENAGRNGGVQPELFFRIAREWHYLHEQTRNPNENSFSNEQKNISPTSSRVRASRSSPTANNRGASSSLNGRDEHELIVYMTPEQFVQEQMHQQAQEMLGRPLPRCTNPEQFACIYPPFYGSWHHCPLPQQAVYSRRIQNFDSFALPYSIPDEMNLSDIPRFLQNAYRVGMKALEALKSRMPDDRPDVKYAIAPPSSQDIRWMCALSASLGSPYLKNFCKVVYNAVTSPYLLHDLGLEAARHFSLFNPAQLASYLRSPSVSPLVQKALAMYTEHVHHELVVLTAPGYANFVDLLRRVRSAFCMAPGGMTRFNEILDVVRKTYPKKRELWQLIMNGLSKA